VEHVNLGLVHLLHPYGDHPREVNVAVVELKYVAMAVSYLDKKIVSFIISPRDKLTYVSLVKYFG